MTAITLNILWTIVAFTPFVGIVIWAWSGKRKSEFMVLARLPLEYDRPVVPVSKS